MGNYPDKPHPKANQHWIRLYELPPPESLIGELPDEIWIRVFKHFTIQDLIVIQFCCKRTCVHVAVTYLTALRLCMVSKRQCFVDAVLSKTRC